MTKFHRHTFLFLLILSLGVNSSKAQLTWTGQFPGTSGATYKDVFFVNTYEGWVVGYNGLIYHTLDAGMTWVQQSSFTSNNLQSIWFNGSELGWIVGDGGLLLKTTDGGDNWVAQFSPGGSTSPLYDIFFIDDQHGWICGSVANYATTDGGTTWTSFLISTGTAYNAHFVNPNDGWICATGQYIGYSHDGGNTWTQSSFPAVGINAVFAHTFNKVTAVCDDGSIYQTTDGGSTWIMKQVATGNALVDVSFSDDMIGAAVGVAGNVYVTFDGGESWYSSIVMSNNIFSVQMVDNGVGWLCGFSDYVYKSAFGVNDLVIYAYHGLDTLCSEVVTPVVLTIYNNGPAPIQDADIVIADGTTPLLYYHWSGLLTAGQYQDIYVGQTSVTHSGNYTGVISGDSLESNNISYKYIEVLEKAGAASEDVSICKGDSVTINAYGGNSYVWLNAGSDTTNAYQTVKPEYDRWYNVYITTDICSYYDSVIVYVSDCSEIITAISPNGDGVNDFLYIDLVDGVGNTVTIYNRWGDAIRTLINYDNELVIWDGEDDFGNQVVETTYYYTYETSDNSVRRSSWIQIVR